MRGSLFLIALAACSSAPGTGTLVYSEVGTGDLRVLDLESGDDRQIAGGPAGSVAISDDGAYIAFSRGDRIVRVSDRAGAVLELPFPGKGCTPTPTWGPGHSLEWCVADATGSYTALLPTVGATPRLLSTNRVVVSPDGALVAYLALTPNGTSRRGDLVIEHADGTDRRVVRTDVDAIVLGFVPGGEHILVTEVDADFQPSIQKIRISDGALTDLGPGGVGMLSSPFSPRSEVSYSPDGGEVLAITGGQLLGLDLATGVRRLIAEVGATDDVFGAAFVDANRVVFTRHRDMSRGDIGMFRESVEVSGTDGVRTIVDEDTTGFNGLCRVLAVAPRAEFVLSNCGGALMTRLDGKALGGVPSAFDPLGLAADESGMVAMDREGQVSFVTTGGDRTHLADAVSVFAAPVPDTGLQPFAAYAP